MKTIYFNGNVYTGDEALVSAFAVENGKFVLCRFRRRSKGTGGRRATP